MSSAYRWIPGVYFAQGAPAAILTEVSVLIFLNFQLSATQNMFWTNAIGLIPLLFIKLFLAPVIDSTGTKRRWILAMQTTLGALFLASAFVCGFGGPVTVPVLVGLFMLAALCSAMHDVASDGFYIIALSEHDQAVYSGLRSVFNRVAMIAVTGGLTMLSGYLLNSAERTPKTTWLICLLIPGLFFFLLALYHCRAIPRASGDVPNHADGEARASLRDFGAVFTSFLAKPHIGTALAFLLLYRLGEAQLGGVSKLFLIGDLQITQTQYGLLAGTIGVSMMLAGGILSGLLTAKVGLGRLLWPMALALNLPDLLYVFLAFHPTRDLWTVGSFLAIEQFGYGFGFTGFMLFMVWFAAGSGACKTSHFALMTVFMILGLRLPGMGSGWLLQQLPLWFADTGLSAYQLFFLWVIVCTLPGFWATYRVTRVVDPGFGLSRGKG